MRFLIATVGSHGDVLPFIALGRAFAARGAEVILTTNPHFEPLVAGAGLGFRPVGTEDDYQRLFGGDLYRDPMHAMAAIAGALWPWVLPAHAAMRADIKPGETIAIGSTFAFPARLLAETDGVPSATVHLAPSVFRSVLRPPRMTRRGAWMRRHAPLALNRAVWWLTDLAFSDPQFTRPLNAVRAQLGLAPVAKALTDPLHAGDALIAMFPRWFAPPAADWPAPTVFTGFPLEDLGAQRPLPDALARFLDAGPPPVVFTAGTANGAAQPFFARAVAACGRAGLRGVLVSHFEGQVPEALPPGVMHVDYAPYGALLPRAAAFAHHAGIGTLAQALRAGVPQLLHPTAFDQFDNAEHALALGIGREWHGRTGDVAGLAQALRTLVNDTALRTRCAAVAARLRDEGSGVEAACEAILARCGPRLGDTR